MRINNWKHVPWIVFVCLATIAACILYVGNFHPARLPSWIHLPASLIQTPTEHHTVGGTPLGLWFGWLGLIYLDRAPNGRPPAWAAGEAIPWPRPGEDPARAAPAQPEVVEGDASEVFAQPADAADHSARRERARKRKRKRRR